jgi:hypothetical protein
MKDIIKDIIKWGVIIAIIFNPYISLANDSIYLCGMILKIGMLKNDVFSQINKNKYKIDSIAFTEPDTTGSIIIRDKGKKSIKSRGIIFYENNNIYQVNKDWGDFAKKSSVEFWRTLSTVLSKLERENEKIIEIKQELKEEPDFFEETTSFEFNNKSIIISFCKSSNKLIITEVLHRKLR